MVISPRYLANIFVFDRNKEFLSRLPGEGEISKCNFDIYYGLGKANSICESVVSVNFTKDSNKSEKSGIIVSILI